MSACPDDWSANRWRVWGREGFDLRLPETTGVEYLLDIMAPEGLGWCTRDQMGGLNVMSWQEISCFSQQSGLELEPWEARQLRSMSVNYVAGFLSGQKPMTVSPAYEDRPEEDPGVSFERKKLSMALGSALSSMASG